MDSAGGGLRAGTFGLPGRFAAESSELALL
jgi:hypothetical protein